MVAEVLVDAIVDALIDKGVTEGTEGIAEDLLRQSVADAVDGLSKDAAGKAAQEALEAASGDTLKGILEKIFGREVNQGADELILVGQNTTRGVVQRAEVTRMLKEVLPKQLQAAGEELAAANARATAAAAKAAAPQPAPPAAQPKIAAQATEPKTPPVQPKAPPTQAPKAAVPPKTVTQAPNAVPDAAPQVPVTQPKVEPAAQAPKAQAAPKQAPPRPVKDPKTARLENELLQKRIDAAKAEEATHLKGAEAHEATIKAAKAQERAANPGFFAKNPKTTATLAVGGTVTVAGVSYEYVHHFGEAGTLHGQPVTISKIVGPDGKEHYAAFTPDNKKPRAMADSPEALNKELKKLGWKPNERAWYDIPGQVKDAAKNAIADFITPYSKGLMIGGGLLAFGGIAMQFIGDIPILGHFVKPLTDMVAKVMPANLISMAAGVAALCVGAAFQPEKEQTVAMNDVGNTPKADITRTKTHNLAPEKTLNKEIPVTAHKHEVTANFKVSEEAKVAASKLGTVTLSDVKNPDKLGQHPGGRTLDEMAKDSKENAVAEKKTKPGKPSIAVDEKTELAATSAPNTTITLSRGAAV